MEPSLNKILVVVLLISISFEAANSKLLISLYYESMCPGCMAFDKDQLYPLYSKIPEYLQLDLVPYGNAQRTVYPNGTIVIECQHGKKECKGNILHACGLSKLAPNLGPQFVGCCMSQPSPPDAGPHCAKLLKLTDEYEEIKKCAEGSEGAELLNQNGIKTENLNPPHEWVPWLIFDGVYNKKDMNDGLNDLLPVVCRLLKGQLPPICNQIDESEIPHHKSVCMKKN